MTSHLVLQRIHDAGIPDGPAGVADRVMLQPPRGRIWHIDHAGTSKLNAGRFIDDPCPRQRATHPKRLIRRTMSLVDMVNENLEVCDHPHCSPWLISDQYIHQANELAAPRSAIIQALDSNDLASAVVSLTQLNAAAARILAVKEDHDADFEDDEDDHDPFWGELAEHAQRITGEMAALVAERNSPETVLRRHAAPEVTLRRHELPDGVSYQQGRAALSTWVDAVSSGQSFDVAAERVRAQLGGDGHSGAISELCATFSAQIEAVLGCTDPTPRHVLTTRSSIDTGVVWEAIQSYPHWERDGSHAVVVPDLIFDRVQDGKRPADRSADLAGTLTADEDAAVIVPLMLGLWTDDYRGVMCESAQAFEGARCLI